MKENVLRDSRKKETKPKGAEGKKNLLCGKCKAYACSTDDIRVIKVGLCMETSSMNTREVSTTESTALFISVESRLFCANWSRKKIPE